MYFIRPPFFLKWYYPDLIWNKPSDEKIVYLTFDDGPIPNVTDFVLNTLKDFQIKGTFFCIGDNIRKHPPVFKRIKSEGHTIGNHTYHHLKGWKTDDAAYLEDFEKCQALTQTNLFRPPYGRIKKSQIRSLKSKVESQKFAERTATLNPKPYTSNPQIRKLKDQRPKTKDEVQREKLKIESVKYQNPISNLKSQISDLDIVMWDVLSGDFDTSISPEKCYHNVMNNVKNGSIIVFHDSLKAWDRLEYVLPRVIEELLKRGYQFKKI